ncbi:MAG: hypothetical protein WCJ92_07570 [Alphaproteobacteria bacterium]
MNTSKILLLIMFFLTALGNAATRDTDMPGTKLTNITHYLSEADTQDPKFAQFILQEIPVPAAFETTPLGEIPIKEKLIFSDLYSQLKVNSIPGSVMVVPNYLLKLVPEYLIY